MDSMNEILHSLLSSIQSTAQNAVESFFMIDNVIVGKDWTVEERLAGDYDHIITLGCCNSDYQGVVMVATEDGHSEAFFEEKEELIDIFGELANTYCGMLMDCPDIVEEFGVLSQAVPMYASKRAFFPRAWAVTGKIHVEGSWLQIGFALRSFSVMINR